MNNNRSRAVGNASPSTDSAPESNGDNLPPPNVLHGRPIPDTPVGFMGPYRGLGLPNRGAFGHVHNPMAARCPRRGPRGGRCAKRGYQPRTCGLCGHDRVYDSQTGLNNHATKQHGCYYSLERDCLVPIDQTNLQAHMDRVAHAQRHHYPYGMGPRSRGCATRGCGRGTAPRPSVIPPVRYPYDAGLHFLTPMVVRSGVVTAWPRPQLPVVQPTEDVAPAPPGAEDESLSPPQEEPIPPIGFGDPTSCRRSRRQRRFG